MSGLLNAYSSLLRRRPLMGNILTSAALFATGDVIAQQIIEKKGDKHDFARTGRIVIWGGAFFAPAVTIWFRVLEKVPIKSKLPAAMTKACLDQFIAAPTVLSTFFCVMTLMEGKSLDDAKKKWQDSFVPTLKTNWMVWIPVQFTNMVSNHKLVPPPLRLLFVNCVNVPWNTFLSLQASKGQPVLKEKGHVSEISFGS
ncbi:hypothetical protein TREMEDRAFT_29813 [Tremella mesenterica DSM 1558]|uniref:uncharacterized protein n=1 Tax=Tremella mesenterica (strain ATCC 24925 / CBS 8224 / DSM 1558 / NBRC 9311 / NRRL Y-6157 / RJB 2259-6 / UBC 559-6) TaxID=578456 RepID=UPI0003F48C8E|nr:uncharacterized protein TREMEDRAFT_29813 [Tremella mesenterica DSM 1558]EIW69794.1 hypothetical protein TREMEDRAFT_29813 [Tremella mesenterica DSM 1558]